MLSSKQIDDWITALRSGNYQQDVSCLRSPKGYCCLGVLADLNGVTWLPMGNLKRYLARFEEYDYYSALPSRFLPASIMETLIDLNDYQRKSFSEIADYIEEHRNAFTRAD